MKAETEEESWRLQRHSNAVTRGVMSGRSNGVNAFRAGRFGGSKGFRQMIARELQAGNFPAHCFSLCRTPAGR
jgi:hypothetical protein